MVAMDIIVVGITREQIKVGREKSYFFRITFCFPLFLYFLLLLLFPFYFFLSQNMPNRRAQNISEAKLTRLLEYNRNLKEQLDIPRITISEASTRFYSISYLQAHKHSH